MTITPDTRVVGVEPDITSAKFEQVLQAGSSPAADTARSGYQDIIDLRVSPAFALAIFKHESRFGTVGLVPQYGLRNPGATRSTRSGEGEVIQIPGRGPFVRYPTWTAGWTDLAFRLVDPKFVYITEGRKTIRQIIERWAPADDGNAPDSYINAVVHSMNEWTQEVPMSAQIPGFKWRPADSRHHTKGRTSKITGFAVHYTAGTDSLGWLTTSPNSNVSATFLIKHNPTLEDRGWQLVRIEDTPHTTGQPVNNFTVSFEYEQLDGQHIPDVAYQVMAQTILDAAEYVSEHGLGDIPLNRQAIKGHKEWVGDNRVCPDGIEVDRIVSIIQSRPPDTDERTFPETGFSIRGRIRARWEDVERHGLALQMIGFPKSEEYEVYKNEVKAVRQDFERVILEYTEGDPHPWDVTALPRYLHEAGDDYKNLRLATEEHIKEVEESIKTLRFAL